MIHLRIENDFFIESPHIDIVLCSVKITTNKLLQYF